MTAGSSRAIVCRGAAGSCRCPPPERRICESTLPGDWAEELPRDPLSAWFKAATTLIEHGLLDGFRRGWRKTCVEFLDAFVSA